MSDPPPYGIIAEWPPLLDNLGSPFRLLNFIYHHLSLFSPPSLEVQSSNAEVMSEFQAPRSTRRWGIGLLQLSDNQLTSISEG
jgi:hypothetical protein